MLWPHYHMWLMWQCDWSLLTLTFRVLKINWKEKNEKESKKKLSPLSVILTSISYFINIISFTYFSHFWKKSKKSKILISVISFVDNGLFISQNKSFNVSNSNIFCSYWIMSSLLEQSGLVIEHGKKEVFHFSRVNRVFNPPTLDLFILGDPILHPKNMWWYLGFIFDRKLMFQQHINFYANKIISTVKSMKMLRNSLRELIPSQKYLLYKLCILPIILYKLLLWYYNKAPLAYPLKKLRNMQWRAIL